MAKQALCPYCGGMHSKKRAFKRCEERHTQLVWDKKTGSKKRRGK